MGCRRRIGPPKASGRAARQVRVCTSRTSRSRSSRPGPRSRNAAGTASAANGIPPRRCSRYRSRVVDRPAAWGPAVLVTVSRQNTCAAASPPCHPEIRRRFVLTPALPGGHGNIGSNDRIGIVGRRDAGVPGRAISLRIDHDKTVLLGHRMPLGCDGCTASEAIARNGGL